MGAKCTYKEGDTGQHRNRWRSEQTDSVDLIFISCPVVAGEVVLSGFSKKGKRIRAACDVIEGQGGKSRRAETAGQQTHALIRVQPWCGDVSTWIKKLQ